jgi:hypothetical protein
VSEEILKNKPAEVALCIILVLENAFSEAPDIFVMLGIRE